MVTEDDATRPVSIWIVADMETSEGRAMVYGAIKHMVGVRWQFSMYKQFSLFTVINYV